MAGKMDRDDLKRLALILASHVDSLQKLAEQWGEDMADMYGETDADAALGIIGMSSEYAESGSGGLAYLRGLSSLRGRIEAMRTERLQEMLASLRDRMRRLASGEADFAVMWISLLMSMQGRTEDANNVVPLSDSAASEAVSTTLYGGYPLEDVMSRVASADVDRLFRILVRWTGRMRAASVDSVPKREKSRLERSLKLDLRKALETARRQMSANVVMVLNGVSNEMSVAVARMNRRLVEKVMWVTELDDRVCEDCAQLEGETFPPEDAPPCPVHPNCRCRLVPVTEELADESKALSEAIEQ